MTKTKEPEINVEMIDRVIDFIKKRPVDKFDMDVWIDSMTTINTSEDGELLFCDTAVCIGGAACAVSDVKADQKMLLAAALDMGNKLDLFPSLSKWYAASNLSVRNRARTRLGLTERQAHWLFDRDYWPANLLDRIEGGTLTERKAAVLILTQLRDGKDPWAYSGVRDSYEDEDDYDDE